MNDDKKQLAKYIWGLELSYQDNYKKVSNIKRKRIREYIDNLTKRLGLP